MPTSAPLSSDKYLLLPASRLHRGPSGGKPPTSEPTWRACYRDHAAPTGQVCAWALGYRLRCTFCPGVPLRSGTRGSRVSAWVLMTRQRRFSQAAPGIPDTDGVRMENENRFYLFFTMPSNFMD